MLGIAAHRLQDAKRRGRVERRAQRSCGIPLIEWTDDDLARIDGLGAATAIAALDELPEDQRVAVNARVVEERDYEQIAAELQIPEATARKRVSRGLAALRQRLERQETL